MTNPTIESIADIIVSLKLKEKETKEHRRAMEDELVRIISKPNLLEGTSTTETSHLKITITKKLTRKLDYPTYHKIEDSLPENLRCVDLKPSLNMKAYRHLEAADPDLAATFCTTKPARSGVTIKEI